MGSTTRPLNGTRTPGDLGSAPADVALERAPARLRGAKSAPLPAELPNGRLPGDTFGRGRNRTVGHAATQAPPAPASPHEAKLPGPLQAAKGAYAGGARAAAKRHFTPDEQQRYLARSLARRQAAGLKQGHDVMPATSISVRRYQGAGPIQLVRTTPFAQGAFSSAADAVLVSKNAAGHRPVVVKKVSTRPGASQGKGGSEAYRAPLEPQSPAQYEAELRTQSRYEPRLAPIHVVKRFDVMEAVLPEHFAGSLHSLRYTLRDSAHPAEIAAYVGELMFGRLASMHADGVIHRDVKTDNLFVGGRRPGTARVVLGDYGAAVDSHKEAPTGQHGTPGYYAPEVFARGPDGKQRGAARYDAQVDQWSGGIVLLEMLSNDNERNPFLEGVDAGKEPPVYEDFAEWRQEILAGPGPVTAERLADAGGDLADYFLPRFFRAPQVVDYVLRHLLAYDPKERATAAQAAAFFEQQGQKVDDDGVSAHARGEADFDAAIAAKTPQAHEHRYALADLKAAADVVAGLDGDILK